MKICIISNLYAPYTRGGAEMAAEKTAIALSEKHNVFVITTTPFLNPLSLLPRSHLQGDIKVFRFYPLNLFNVYFIPERKIPVVAKIIWRLIDIFNPHTFFTVLYILKKEKPDIVHTGNLGGFSFSAFWTAKLLNIPLLHTLHDCHLICPYAGFLMCPYTKFTVCVKRPWPCRAYSLFKKIIVDSIPRIVIGPSRFIVDMHKKYGFFKKSDFTVIPNFVDTNEGLFYPKKDKKLFDILYVGTLCKGKGADILISAFRYLKEDFLRLHIVGAGGQREYFEKMASGDNRIIFHGKKDRPGLKEIYSFCDLLIVPSIWYETFPTVILEAFSFGLPVIGSKIGGIPELIEDGVNGFLFEPRNIEDLKNTLKIFISYYKNDKKILGAFRENAFRSALKFKKDKIINNIEDVYNLCLKK